MSNKSKPIISADLHAQREYTQQLVDSGFDFGLVLADAFVKGMRDIGYKSTATALNELIDNAIQGEAKNVQVTFGFEKSDKKPDKLAVIDDGHGMDPIMIRAAVLWGGTHRHNDRTSFGRYGYGLPSACISIGQRYTVYSKVEGNDWCQVTIDLQEIENHFKTGKGGHVRAPEPKPAKLPGWIAQHIDGHFKSLNHGTIVLIEKIDRLRYYTTQRLKEFFLHSFGVTYRNYLRDVRISVEGKSVEPIDPLFITPGYRFYDEDDDRAQALEPLTIAVKGQEKTDPVSIITVRFSYMPPTFLRVPEDKLKERGKNNNRFKIRKDNNGIIILRNGRQIDVATHNPWTTFVNNDRYHGIEVDFPPALDEEFSITTSKQQVVLSDRMWDILEQNGVHEALIEMRKQYKKDLAALGVRREQPTDGPRASETAMQEAQKYINRAPVEQTPEQIKESQENLEREAKEKAKQTGLPVEVIKKGLENEASKKPFKVELVDHPGAPFYNVQQRGGQKVLYINKAHRFFTDVYAAPDSTPNMRSRLETLLFVLGDCELKTKFPDFKKYYETERVEWSKYLSIALGQLSDWHNIDDTLASMIEEIEVAESERVGAVQ